MPIIRLKYPVELKEFVFADGALLPVEDIQHLLEPRQIYAYREKLRDLPCDSHPHRAFLTNLAAQGATPGR